TEVKLFCADDSWLRACENRTLLSLFLLADPKRGRPFFDASPQCAKDGFRLIFRQNETVFPLGLRKSKRN
ncbi:hypothetical protein, partial [uncultured Dubosiella sp.]|uniref:hypothetical protein n=1 Tax=uncultured Dubosiella sp. TaxID=1937011 RepID=UPI0025B5C67E